MSFNFAALKDTWFDAPAVMKALNREKKQAFSKYGSFVRRRAKGSIRKRKASAPTGQPPSSHVGTLKNLIFFGWDTGTDSMVVGPVPFGAPGENKAPELLEHSGSVVRPARTIRKKDKPGRDERGKFVTGQFRDVELKARVEHYEGNPFMAPADEAERPKFVAQFRDLF